jgi:porphobilinogen synthase
MKGFPNRRPQRLRRSAGWRRLARETRLHASDLVLPLFVTEGVAEREEVPSMPGVYRTSIDGVLEDAEVAHSLGLGAVLLFGIPDRKDPEGSGAYDPEGIVPRAVRALKAALPELLVWTDVCMCEYTDHGHCGVLGVDRTVDGDATLPLLARTAVAHAQAGADAVAPSDMMDGRVGAIRLALDDAGFPLTPIVSYAAKYASAYYGPFRDAVDSAPSHGDRRTHQMDPANGDEALLEVDRDVLEGADIFMVKPAGPFLDVVWRVKERLGRPVAAYQVSGEYSLIKAAGAAGWIDEQAVAMESVLGIRRAGADIVITYYAREIARWLQEVSS